MGVPGVSQAQRQHGFMRAVQKGDAARVWRFLRNNRRHPLKIDLNQYRYRYEGQWYCRTPLHEAVEGGHRNIVRILLRAGADPNGEGFETPLMIAVRKGDELCVQILLEGERIEGCDKISRANGAKIGDSRFSSYAVSSSRFILNLLMERIPESVLSEGSLYISKLIRRIVQELKSNDVEKIIACIGIIGDLAKKIDNHFGPITKKQDWDLRVDLKGSIIQNVLNREEVQELLQEGSFSQRKIAATLIECEIEEARRELERTSIPHTSFLLDLIKRIETILEKRQKQRQVVLDHFSRDGRNLLCQDIERRVLAPYILEDYLEEFLLLVKRVQKAVDRGYLFRLTRGLYSYPHKVRDFIERFHL